MKRMRDKIVNDLMPRPQGGSFNKGLFSGVVLGVTMTLATGYLNHLVQENAQLRASAQAAPGFAQVPVSTPLQGIAQQPTRAKANTYNNLALPPPFEDQAAGKDYSI